MENLTLKDIIDLGLQGILLVFVGALWQRLNKVTDMFIQDRQQAAAERQAIAKQHGLDTQGLAQEAAFIRQRVNNLNE